MDKNTKQRIWLIMMLAFIINVGLYISDYFNVFTKIGVDVSNINFDIIILIVESTIIVVLFLITYLIVDARNIQKDKNQLMAAHITLIGIYERCQDMVEIFCQADLRERAAKRCEGDKFINEDKAHSHFLNYPFENEAIIYDFAGLGILSKELFEEFIKIKQHYQKYINVAIIFYDHYDQFKGIEREISQILADVINELKQSVEKDLEVQK